MADPRFEIHNQMIEDHLRTVGRAIKDEMPHGWGFTLMMFEFGEGPGFFYLSSAQRADMVKMLKEFLEKLEKG